MQWNNKSLAISRPMLQTSMSKKRSRPCPARPPCQLFLSTPGGQDQMHDVATAGLLPAWEAGWKIHLGVYFGRAANCAGLMRLFLPFTYAELPVLGEFTRFWTCSIVACPVVCEQPTSTPFPVPSNHRCPFWLFWSKNR